MVIWVTRVFWNLINFILGVFFCFFFSFWIKILTRKKNWGKRQKNGRKPFPLLIKKLERKQIEFLHCTTKKSSQRHKDKVLTSVYTQIHMHITLYVLKIFKDIQAKSLKIINNRILLKIRNQIWKDNKYNNFVNWWQALF